MLNLSPFIERGQGGFILSSEEYFKISLGFFMKYKKLAANVGMLQTLDIL